MLASAEVTIVCVPELSSTLSVIAIKLEMLGGSFLGSVPLSELQIANNPKIKMIKIVCVCLIFLSFAI